MKKSLFSMSTAALLASASVTAWAAPISVPNTFSAGSTAVAADVNANFTTVEGGVNTNDGRITTNEGVISSNGLTNSSNHEGRVSTIETDLSANGITNSSNHEGRIGTIETNLTANGITNASSHEGRIAANELAITGLQTACPSDMKQVGPLCVDIYEASVWDAATGGSQISSANIATACDPNGSTCGAGSTNPIYARSVASGVIPASQITWYQAVQACANVGKRLPTTAEWQMAASGTPAGLNSDVANGCNTQTTGVVAAGSSTGGTPECISSSGAFDMVGNVWEWSAELTDLDGTGASFVFTTTDAALTRMLGAAYNASGADGTRALATTNGASGVNNGPLRTDASIGFRCVR